MIIINKKNYYINMIFFVSELHLEISLDEIILNIF
jgi:hypothetical protein